MLRIGSLFSGAGALDLAVEAVFGGRTVWHCELDPAASKVLARHWPGVPNLGSITTIDWTQVEPVDVLCGGFPCTDVSVAGKRAGMHNTRSGLWTHMADAIDALRPTYVVIENVRGLLSANANRPLEPEPDALGDNRPKPVLRGLGAVLGDLSDLGFDADWTTISAASVGAPHLRERVFILASLTDASGDGRHRGRTQPARRLRRSDASFGGDGPVDLLPTPSAADGGGGHLTRSGDRSDELLLAGIARAYANGALLPTPRTSDTNGPGKHGDGGLDLRTAVTTQWGKYERAVRRWEHIFGPAPSPTEPNNGKPRLNPAFSQWMMGWPAGWVTEVPGIGRNAQLRIIGNGVVPQQSIAALQWLLHINEVAA